MPNLASPHLSTKEAHVTGAEEADKRVVAGAEPSVEAVGESKGEFEQKNFGSNCVAEKPMPSPAIAGSEDLNRGNV